jgi:hypothetical protein
MAKSSMTQKIAQIRVACLISVLATSAWCAPITRLFDSDSYVPESQLRTILHAPEAQVVHAFRSRPQKYRDVRVVRLNRSALNGTSLVLVMPDGMEHQYVGSKVFDEASRAVIWRGNAKSGGRFTFAETDEGCYGQISAMGKSYQLQSLPGKRLYILAEAALADAPEEGNGEPQNPRPTPQFGGN